MVFEKPPVSIGILNPDATHARYRLRATKSSMNRMTLQLFQFYADNTIGVKGRICGPFGDGRYRLQYYGKDAELWAQVVGFFETERGKRYKELCEEASWYGTHV